MLAKRTPRIVQDIYGNVSFNPQEEIGDGIPFLQMTPFCGLDPGLIGRKYLPRNRSYRISKGND
jgi:hypothetical protein